MILCDKTNFEEEVLKGSGPILVDFFGDGCVPCASLMPHVEELAGKYEDKLKFCKLNTTKARRVAIGQKVMGLPVIAMYQDGEKIEELIKDDATPDAIEAMIQKYL